MRATPVLLCLALMAAMSLAAQEKPATANPPNYDAGLAERLGADEYGMKSYVLVLLKTGAQAGAPKAERQKAFAGHMANIQRLADEGKLVVAGPLLKNDHNYEGIFIFNVKTVKEAEALLATDPAVASGLLAFEAYGWYGTAALTEIVSIHNRIQKKSP